MEPEKCRKCGANTFIAKHKGPHIGWYCTRCGAWLRWIPQHNNKAVITEQQSIEIPEERTCRPKTDDIDINSLYDDDSLPWE